MTSAAPIPYRDILKLVWPLALGMVNNALMQFVDRAFLARASMTALEAVLPASVLAWIFLGFFQSVVAYAGVFVAQCHGAGDRRGAVASYRAGVVVALLSGVAMLPLVPLGGFILEHATATSALAMHARAYFDVVAFGGIFVFAQMAAASYFTGTGRTRIVFWTNVAGNLLNVALDPLLIFGCDIPFLGGRLALPAFGIAGAAYATVASLALQGLVLFCAAPSLRTKGADASRGEGLRLIRRLLRFGVPAGGYTVLNMLSFTIFVFVTGWVGDVAFAASNACFTVNYLLFAPMEGFALGAQTLVGQARGRGDDDGAALACRRTLRLGLAFVLAFTALVLAFHRPILALFAPSDPAAAAEFTSLGLKLFMLMGCWLVFDAADVIVSGALKGAGDTRFVFLWMLIASFGIWMPLVWCALRLSGTMVSLWSTMIVFVTVITAGSLVRWRLGRWRRQELVFDVNVKGGPRAS